MKPRSIWYGNILIYRPDGTGTAVIVLRVPVQNDLGNVAMTESGTDAGWDGSSVKKCNGVQDSIDSDFENPAKVPCYGAIKKTQPLLQTVEGVWEEPEMVDKNFCCSGLKLNETKVLPIEAGSKPSAKAQVVQEGLKLEVVLFPLRNIMSDLWDTSWIQRWTAEEDMVVRCTLKKFMF
jgi:hypothetical protein